MKKIFLLSLLIVGVTTVRAQVPEEHPLGVPAIVIEAKHIDLPEKIVFTDEIATNFYEKLNANQLTEEEKNKIVNKAHFYLTTFLNIGIQQGVIPENCTEKDLFKAFFEARASEKSGEEEFLGDVYHAEEFLQKLKENYPQNPPYPFPKELLTPSFVARVLNILQ